jgi:nucleoside 2-deoxyribosyltransferase
VSDGKTFTFYFGGELFSTKHLLGNAMLAEAIRRQSQGRYVPILPQDLEQRDTTPHAIRDQDLRTLLACDFGLFNYDGPELDSGTVVEFLFAKFADIPAVLLRTDFRRGGDQAAGSDPWNLMTSFYPRTATVILDAMAMYQSALLLKGSEPENTNSVPAAESAIAGSADQIISAFDQLLEGAPILPPALRDPVYQWLSLLPGFRAAPEMMAAELGQCLAAKMRKGLL